MAQTASSVGAEQCDLFTREIILRKECSDRWGNRIEPVGSSQQDGVIGSKIGNLLRQCRAVIFTGFFAGLAFGSIIVAGIGI